MSHPAARLLVVCAIAAAAAGCPPSAVADVATPRSLSPYPNPMGPEDPRFEEQPNRDKPQELVASADGRTLFVSLPGTADRQGGFIAVVNAKTGALIRRIEVGAGPGGLVLHPGGRWLVVLNRYSNYASVIDTETLEVAHRPPMDFYAIEGVFNADGSRLFVTNRMHDAVQVWDVVVHDEGLELQPRATLAVGENPRDLAIQRDGSIVAVAAVTGLDVTLIDARTLERRGSVQLGAPANGLAFAGRFLLVATLSASTHHSPLVGPDTDGDGIPGDGTPNVNFQDLQNEIAVIDAADGSVAHRYTSDTICCRDFRDVDPTDSARHGELLPPASTWIVAGALPEQVITSDDGARAWVSMSASDQVQAFAVDQTSGALSSRAVFATEGHSPHGLALIGDVVWVAERLSETVAAYDAVSGALQRRVEVGDLSGGAFPATDAEIGELVNDVTAGFAVDGDQACVHCHRENGNIAKALSMPLTAYPGVGLRMVMAYRGAADTRPWFMESAMDEGNFRPVINEFARIENFCCSDYTLWPAGAPADCATHPPAECTSASNPSSADGFGVLRDASREPWARARPSAAPSRDVFFVTEAERLIGRSRSFGTGLFFQDPVTGERDSVPLDFDGITRALGIFLLAEPRLLPNPFDANEPAVLRGRAIFESSAVGCATCHPAPTFAASTDNNPAAVPLRMDPVVTPVRRDDGVNLDLLSNGFVEVFPGTEMDTCSSVCGDPMCTADPRACDDLRDVRFGPTTLRGIWDRAARFLHDGRARSLREVLCTPGHPALQPGEIGFNERDGIPNTHGSTSQLTTQEIDDLVRYLRTL